MSELSLALQRCLIFYRSPGSTHPSSGCMRGCMCVHFAFELPFDDAALAICRHVSWGLIFSNALANNNVTAYT